MLEVENIKSFYFFNVMALNQKTRSTGAQLARRRGRSPLFFFENQNKYLDFSKKDPDCVHPQVKFTIQNVVFRVSRRKNFEIFPAGLFFLEFLTKCLSKCPNFTKPSVLKNFWLSVWSMTKEI